MTSIATNENGGATEVDTAVSADARAVIPHADTAKDSGAASNGQRHTLEAVGVGIMRFFEDFRALQSLDAEAEVGTPLLCIDCGFYPAAWMLRCWSCNSKMRLPS